MRPDDYAIIPGSGRLFERQVELAAIAGNSGLGDRRWDA
jgi:hypothetical protein